MRGLVRAAVKGTAEDKESICRIWQKSSTEEALRLADVLDKGGLIKANGLGGTIKQILASRADMWRRAEDVLLCGGSVFTWCCVALA